MSMREGYALLAVLWMCVGVGALGLAISAAAGDATTASRNRIALTRAEYLAEACLARARSVLADALRDEQSSGYGRGASAWISADRILKTAPVLTSASCDITATAVGARLNVNAVEEGTLARLLHRIGVPAARADSIAAAISDWKDADDAPRARGAERDWYQARGLPTPGNRGFRSVHELRLVRGVGDTLAIDRFLDVELGAVSLNHAPPEILSVLPGFTPSVADRVNIRRVREPLRSFAALSKGLSASEGAALAEALPRLAALTSFDPEGWIVTAHGRSGIPEVTVAIELRLEQIGPSTGAVRRRAWIP